MSLLSLDDSQSQKGVSGTMLGHTIKPRREDVLAQRAAHVGRATGIACDAVCAKADGDLVKAARLFREAASKSKRGDVKARYLASAKACREELDHA